MASFMFKVPDQYGGKSLQSALQQAGAGGRPDLIANELGMGQNSLLQAGQYLTANSTDPGYTNSAEYQALGGLFGGTINPAVAQASQMNDFYKQQNAPQISALQGEIDPTKQAYGSATGYLQQALPSLTQSYQSTIDNLTKATNREYAARGIPTTSLSAVQNLGQALAPAQANMAQGVSQFNNTIGQLGIQGQQDINSIQSAIGQLQTGNPTAATNAAMQQLQMNSPLALAQSQLAQAQAQAAQYVPVPGYGIYNTQLGKLLGGLSGVNQQGVINQNGIPMVWVP